MTDIQIAARAVRDAEGSNNAAARKLGVTYKTFLRALNHGNGGTHKDTIRKLKEYFQTRQAAATPPVRQQKARLFPVRAPRQPSQNSLLDFVQSPTTVRRIRDQLIASIEHRGLDRRAFARTLTNSQAANWRNMLDGKRMRSSTTNTLAALVNTWLEAQETKTDGVRAAVSDSVPPLVETLIQTSHMLAQLAQQVQRAQIAA